jgi:polysaccharide export outer membrane protein
MRRLSVTVSIAAGLLAIFAGPGAGRSTAAPQDQRNTAAPSAEPKSVPSASGVDPKTYKIGAEDVILVRVWREPELSGQFPVRPDGRISLPLVNEVVAEGLTPEQLSDTIAKGLSRYMTQPEVSVAVQQVNSKKYFIIGEVQKPGSYPLTVPTTVLEALVNAGGFRDFANTKKIIIMRKGQRLKFNYKEVIGGKKMEQNIGLESGDQIIVP